MKRLLRRIMRTFSVMMMLIGILVPTATVALLFLMLVLADIRPDTLWQLSTSLWHPERQNYGLVWLIYSSVALAVPAAGVSVILGTLAALRLVFFAPPLEYQLGMSVVSVLAGLPSITVGLFTLSAVTPLLGISALSGAVAIALMIMPGFVLATEGTLRALPAALPATGISLGYSFAQLLWRVVLPLVWPGLIANACLALARALGEATAVSLVVGNTFSRLPPAATDTLLTLSGAVLRGHKEATGDYLQALYAASALLILMIGALVLAGLVLRTLHTRRLSS